MSGGREASTFRRAAHASRCLTTLAGVLVVACAPPPRAGAPAPSPTDSPWVQTAWALRADTLPAPDAPAGLVRGGAALEVAADQPFRLRFEVERAGTRAPSDTSARFTLQVRHNDGAWAPVLARDFPYPDELSTPRASIVHATTWSSGSAAGDLLDGSTAPFAGGAAVARDSVSAPVALRGGAGPLHTEWEWALVVRRWADGPVLNETGDRFTFRMVDDAGRPVASAAGEGAAAAVTLRVPEAHLGGTFVETPGVLGPWQAADGTLYFPMEPAETDNVLLMVTSSDGGVTWREADGAHRPATDDLEGVAAAMQGGRIWLLHQVSEATYLHAFATRDAAGERERWVVRDELVARHAEPPTQVAALVADPEGRLTAVYGDSLGLRVRSRAPDGAWGAERRLDGPDGAVASGIMAVRGADGRIHAAYTAGTPAGRDVWYATISREGVPSEAVHVASGVGTDDEDVGAVAPLVHLDDAGATVLLYRLQDGRLRSRTVRRDGSLTPARVVSDRPVVQNASDSEQVGADAIAFEGRVVVAVIDEATRGIRTIEGRLDPSGEVRWAASRPLVDGVKAQWLRGRVIRDATGAPAYGIVYDAGSDGGSGLNRFVTYPLR